MWLPNGMPYEPTILGLKFAIRVHHLTVRDVLVVTCPSCHKAYWVATHTLYKRFHEHLPIEVVAKEFRCKRCGRTDGLSWRIERATGPEFPRSA